jgi:hypothetical protein
LAPAPGSAQRAQLDHWLLYFAPRAARPDVHGNKRNPASARGGPTSRGALPPKSG